MSSRKAKAAFARLFCAILLLLPLFASAAYAEGNKEPTVGEAIQKRAATGQEAVPGGGAAQPLSESPDIPGAGGNVTSGWTLFFQVIFSLGLVVLLIYLLLRFLSKRSFAGLTQNGPMKMISAMPLGNGKSVQIVMIGDSLYILGVGEEVHLLRHIPAGEEMDLLLAEAEIKTANGLLANWLPLFRGKRERAELDTLESTAGTFEELLTKQWSEVNDVETAKDRWSELDGPGKGESR
jgi:flagellar protein FliO/FliZ